MTTKKYFIMLSLLIPGPRAIIGENFDVYLSPLIEELEVLWSEGVLTRDAAAWNDEASFVLRAMVIGTIHDLPAYGVVAGCTTKGYYSCPVCGPNTRSRRSSALHKNVYEHHRNFLPQDHNIRADVRNYGKYERSPPPPRVFGFDVIRFAAMREVWLAPGTPPSPRATRSTTLASRDCRLCIGYPTLR
jgi:hypothetical protein